MKTRKLTKQELGQAQMLLNMYRNSQQIGDQRDPERNHVESVAFYCDTIARAARDAFFALCGRHPEKISLVEINVVDPADWTQAIPV